MISMELDEFINFDIAHTITIGHKKWLITYVLPNTPNTTTSHCIVTSIDYRHLPRLHISLVNNHFVLTVTIIESNIRAVE